MSGVRSKNTKPELIVRSAVHRMGYRFRLHRKDLPGKPDIVLPKHKKVILVHGCFWHGHKGCPGSKRPSSNIEFWNDKLEGNIIRDAENIRKLEELGWKPLVIWECETKKPDILYSILNEFLNVWVQRQRS